METVHAVTDEIIDIMKPPELEADWSIFSSLLFSPCWKC